MFYTLPIINYEIFNKSGTLPEALNTLLVGECRQEGVRCTAEEVGLVCRKQTTGSQ